MISNRIAQEIVRKERLPTTIKKVPTYANAVYKVKRDFILKIYDSENEWRNTLLAYGLIQQHHLASPKIIAKGKTPAPYIIMEFLKGNPISKEPTPAAYQDFGRWVGKLHQITFTMFGGLKGIEKLYKLGPFATWKELHLALVQERMKGFEKTILKPLIPRIHKYFRAAQYPNFKPTLIHEDLNTKNVFVKQGKVIGVIDPDGAFAGCIEEELMRIEIAHFSTNSKLKKAFFKGYIEHTKLLPGYEQRKPLFHLSRTLVEASCLIHLKDYKANHKKQAMQEVYRIIDSIV